MRLYNTIQTMLLSIFRLLCSYFKILPHDNWELTKESENLTETNFWKSSNIIFNDLNISFQSNSYIKRLSRYIYVENDDLVINTNFVKRCNKNFMVYIVTVNNRQELEKHITKKENICVSTNGSNAEIPASSLKNKSAPESIIDSKIPTPKSRIPVGISKSKTTSSNIKLEAAKHKSLQNISQNGKEQAEVKPNKGYELFKKFIGFPKSRHSKSGVSITELFIKDFSFGTSSNKTDNNISKNQEMYMENVIMPVSYVNIPNPYLDYTMAEAMREMVEIGSKIRESEARVIDVVKKYINDKHFENDLLNITCGHEKLLLDSGRRALNITNDTWFQQAEIYKDQQKSLQNTIEAIVQKNRDLHSENELMVRKNEQLYSKIVIMQETHTSTHRSPAASAAQLLEDMNKQNDKLRMKLCFMGTRVDELEESLKMFQKKNSFLQQQLNTNNLQLENTKAIHERSKADDDLEIAKLLHEVQENNIIIKQVTEAGDILLEDFDSIKAQLETSCETINWNKLKRKGKSPVDVMHLSRACLNELTKELLSKDNKIRKGMQELENLKLDIEQQKVIADELLDEKNKLNDEVACARQAKINLKLMQDREKDILNKLIVVDKISDLKTAEVQDGYKTIKALELKIKNLDYTIADKDGTIVRMRENIAKLELERTSFQAQINGMAQVLSATGTGEIAKELASSQEKLTQIQALHLSLVAEKSFLQKQIEDNNSERETLVSYQKSCYDQLKMMQKDIELQEKSNEDLKEQLETEKHTVAALQNERVRHLEERSVLIALFERLRTESTKVDELEGAVSSMNQKAGKLAMIAAYNKQLGEQLQIVVAEKDVAITELQNNVNALSSIHRENTKEKVALCEELTQVFTVKEDLHNKLSAELEKNAMLGETKKEQETVACVQLIELQEKYDKQHLARKVLAKDLKAVTIERDRLENANKERVEKIKQLELDKMNLIGNADRLKLLISELSSKISMNEKEAGNDLTAHKDKAAILEGQLSFYKDTSDTLKNLMESMVTQNTDLKNSVEFLQNDIKKLQHDLNQSRENEQVYKKLSKESKQQRKVFQDTIDEKILQHDTLSEDYHQLNINYYKLQDDYTQLKEEYAIMSDETNRIKMIVSEKFPDTKPSSMESNSYTKDIAMRDEEILTMQEKMRELEEDNVQCSDLIADLSTQRDIIAKDQKQTKEELAEVQENYDQSLQQISELEDLLHSYDKKHRELLDDVEKRNSEFEAKIENITSTFESQIGELNNTTNHLNQVLKDTTIALEAQVASKAKLQKAHRELALKLMRAIKVWIAEKSANNQLHELHNQITDENMKIKSEKVEQVELIAQQRSQILELNSEINSLITKKETMVSWSRQENEERRQSSEDSNTELVDGRIVEYEKRVTTLKALLEKDHVEIANLLEQVSNYESKYACLEFQKCESILRLHEAQGKMHSEKARNEELVQRIKVTIELLLALREKGSIPREACNTIIATVRN